MPGRQPATVSRSPARTARAQEGAHRGRRAPGAGSERRALRADTALQDVDLALQPADLASLLRARQRIAVDTQGVRRMARAAVGVAQVLGHGRVVARELDGALEMLHRPPIVAALVVHPAEAVDVEAVVGLDLERAADQLLRLVEADAHLGVRVPEVIQRRRVLRVELDGAPHLLERALLLVGLVVGGAVEVALLEEDEAHLDARLARIVGRLLERLELAERLVELLLPRVDAGEPAPYRDALRIEREDALVELDRLVGTTLELVGNGEVGEDELRLRAELQGVEVGMLRLVELVRRRVDPAEVIVCEHRRLVHSEELPPR